MIIQIYAFTEIEQAQEAVQMGVDHIGFVAGDYGVVPAELTFAQARRLADSVKGKAKRLALTMATQVDEILRMAEIVEPDIVHVSTDVYDVDVKAMADLRRRLPASMQIMKAIAVDDERSVAVAREFAPYCDWILLDTKVKGMPGVGATGRVHDWGISRKIVETAGVPVILAGGLTPQNVAQAIAAAGPKGVDSNTSTNIPGDIARKDMQRIRDFVAAIRKAEKGSVA